ncbi:AEC family transporter [Spelaeicoccus albus]|uniref:AEC family transporter n=1 Tax=Spelaeicoccus albus TaxID=1280376 RepID=A0A7Z0CZ98_9MICO|nr:AEC family transporter [Spelaeicoccus albus]NYI66054.1 hypothetical protein [Spelaeicoccus albus]
MGGVLTGFSIIAFVIAVGYVIERFQICGPRARPVFNRTAFFVTNPALLFTVLAGADLHAAFSTVIRTSLISAVLSAAIFVGVSRLFFRRKAAETTIGALASSYVNANNIGIPVASYVLGDATYVAPVLLLQLIVFAPTALTVLDMTTRASVSLRAILTQPFRNPMIIASAVGVVVSLTGVHLPDPVFEPFKLLGGAAVPLVLMAFGMSLSGSKPLKAGSGRKEILTAAALKSVGMPAIAFVSGHFLFGASGHLLFVMVVLAALPGAQNIYNFADTYSRGQTIARDSILLTTIAAVPVLIVIAAFLA